VHPFENLLIDCARDVGAGIIIRGLRAVADFEYEFQMVGMNRKLDAEIVTVFLMAEADRQAIASKLVKEIARLGGDVSHFVPPPCQRRCGKNSRAEACAPNRQSRIIHFERDMAEIKDPENTILIELKDGTVTIELLPDVAPQHSGAHEGTGARGRL
jgi:hypothetical protein